jgi:hypothetical protein
MGPSANLPSYIGCLTGMQSTIDSSRPDSFVPDFLSLPVLESISGDTSNDDTSNDTSLEIPSLKFCKVNCKRKARQDKSSVLKNKVNTFSKNDCKTELKNWSVWEEEQIVRAYHIAGENALKIGYTEPNHVFWVLVAGNLAKLSGSMERSEDAVQKKWEKLCSEDPKQGNVTAKRKSIIMAARRANISFLMKEQPLVQSSIIFCSKLTPDQLCAPILDDTASNQSDDAFFNEVQISANRKRYNNTQANKNKNDSY